MPLADEEDNKSSHGPGPHPLSYHYQPLPLCQTDFQSLLQPSVTPQQGDLRAYTLNTWEAFNTEQLGGMANMQALTSKGVGYELGAVVVNATAPAAQTSPYPWQESLVLN